MSEEGSVYFGGNVEVSDPVVYQGFRWKKNDSDMEHDLHAW